MLVSSLALLFPSETGEILFLISESHSVLKKNLDIIKNHMSLLENLLEITDHHPEIWDLIVEHIRGILSILKYLEDTQMLLTGIINFLKEWIEKYYLIDMTVEYSCSQFVLFSIFNVVRDAEICWIDKSGRTEKWHSICFI